MKHHPTLARRSLAAGVVVFALTAAWYLWFAGPGPLGTLQARAEAAQVELFDLTPFQAELARMETFASWPDAVRDAYPPMITGDCLFALLNGLAFLLLIRGLRGRPALQAVPVIGALLDFAENGLTALALAGAGVSPNGVLSPTMAFLSTTATSLKFIFVGLTSLIFLGLLVARLAGWWRTRAPQPAR